jgi:tetratricopeptide (TPR) repeat protein/tRNA A-37 threonylcarbamoyl transferase component Bud32
MSDDLSTGPEERPPQADTTGYERALPRSKSGRYVVRKFHARGGMGEVWLADDEHIGRPVALKRLRLERFDQKERFLIEAQVTGQLEHPGIVPVHDVGTDEGDQPFYIMSFVGGRTLKDVIADYHAPGGAGPEPRQVQRLRLLDAFVQICQTIGYAHSRGVIHRDLKPDNVMLGPYGETVVLDWGLAKVKGTPEQPAPANYVHLTYGASSTATHYGTVIGAPPYMAPEEAEGKATEADERTDVYLLGGTLYTILTGHTPRKGRSREEMVELARTVPPVPPRQLKPEVPRELEAICLRAMAQRKQDRYASAAELATEVQRYLAGEPVAAYPEPLPARAWRWCKGHQRALGRSAAAALLVGLMAFGLVSWQQHGASLQRAEDARTAAEQVAHEARQREEVREQVNEFRRLVDDLHYQVAPGEVPVGKQPPYSEQENAQATGAKILELADKWSGGAEGLPQPEERAAVKEELSAALLLLAQLQSPPEGQKLRARAEALQGAADSPQRLAMKHFLEGERHRRATLKPPTTSTDEPGWRPDVAELAAAEKEYRAALLLRPNDYWANYQLGRCLLSQGRRDEAASALGTCVALRPEAPWAWSARGLAQADRKDAERDFDEALRLRAGFMPAKLNRAALYWKQKDFDKALAELKDVTSAEGSYYRGLVLLDQEKYADALKEFRKVDNKFRPVYLLRALASIVLGQEQNGLVAMDAYLGITQPESAEAFEKRGAVLRRLLAREKPNSEARKRLTELAEKQLREAEKKGGQSAELFHELGSVLHVQEKKDEALSYYDQGLKLDPEHAQLRMKRGILFAEYKKYKKARDDFDMAARSEKERDRVEALTWLGIVQVREEAVTGALETAARALLYVPDQDGRPDYFVVHNVACIFAELAKKTEPAAKRGREDICLEHLRREIALAKLSGMGAKAVAMIEREAGPGGSFDELKKSRPQEWQKVLESGKKGDKP